MIALLLKICGFFTFNINGWTFENKLPADVKKYVLLAAPHTSNWDLYYALLCFRKMGVPVRFAIKNDWLKFPFKTLMIALGAIGVDRSKNTQKISLVDAIVDLFNQHDELVLCITPEGTRGRSPKWKTGFHIIAQKAQVPIALGILDYRSKKASIHKFIYPGTDMRKDFVEIISNYDANYAKYPENFAFDIEATLENK